MRIGYFIKYDGVLWLACSDVEANTIAKNTANSTYGNLIKFSGDTKAGSEDQTIQQY